MPYSLRADLTPGCKGAEKSVKHSLVFSVYYSDEISHCPVESHLNVRDIRRLIYLRISENTDILDVKTKAQNFLLFSERSPI
jgi:hypothetical protein